MKIQCNVCEVAEANVLCCADEAALCWHCDEKVHTANKIVSKHQRVPLSHSVTQMPKCDICRDMIGYFFCMEDRALLCRKCDVAIHTVNSLVSGHQRFLLTGVKVGLESTEPAPSPMSLKSRSNEKIYDPKVSLPIGTSQVSITGQSQTQSSRELPAPGPSAGGSAAGSIPPWQLDEFLGFGDFNQTFNFTDNSSSKADNGKLGDSDGSPSARAADGELEGDESLGLVPDAFWVVPQIPSPPTASGLSCTKNYQDPSDSAVFVPDITASTFHNCYHSPESHLARVKRRRHF